MKKRLLFVALLTAFFINSCAIFINDDNDDDNERDTNDNSSDTLTVTIISHSRNILEP